MSARWTLGWAFVVFLGACKSTPADPRLPLEVVAEVSLPGAANRFDYQDIDSDKGHLLIAHMNDDAVIIAKLSDGSVVKEIRDIPTARGIAVAPEAGRIFVTSSPSTLVVIDRESMEVTQRIDTGRSPDGVAWDPVHKVVATSDQGEGAISLIGESGDGERRQVALGSETGNVIFDKTRESFWITVVGDGKNEVVGVDPVAGKVTERIAIAGCEGAHGLRLDTEAKTALVACEGNAVLARVPLDGKSSAVTASTPDGPDVLSVDPGLGWIYLAAEGGDLSIFDIAKPGLTLIDAEDVGENAHTVIVDPATHRVFLPLEKGPVLRIMKPKGI